MLTDKATSVTLLQPSDDLLIRKLDLATVEGEKRYVAGYANIADIVDKQNEVVTLDALKRAWDKFSKDPMWMISTFMHQNIPIARIVAESITDTAGRTHKSGVDDKGLYVVAEIRSDLKIADQVWEQVKAGKLRGFSIGGQCLAESNGECKGNSCPTRIEDMELHEVAIVDRPANPVSIFNILKRDDLAKLSDVTNQLRDSVIIGDFIRISKTPCSKGLYRVVVKGICKSSQLYKSIQSLLSQHNRLSLVELEEDGVEYIPLFDLSLLRPFSLEKDLAGESAPGGFKPSSSLTDKPESTGEPVLSEEVKSKEKQEESQTDSSKSLQDKPIGVEVKSDGAKEPVTETKGPEVPETEEQGRAIAPITLETLMAELAKLNQRLDEHMKSEVKPTRPFIDSLKAWLEDKEEKAEYPWDQCIKDRLADGYSQERANKICAAIKNRTVRRCLDTGKAKTIEEAVSLVSKEVAENPITEYLAEKIAKSATTDVAVTQSTTTNVPTVTSTVTSVPQTVTEPVKPAEPAKPVEVLETRGQVVQLQSVPTPKLDLLSISKVSWREIEQKSREVRG